MAAEGTAPAAGAEPEPGFQAVQRALAAYIRAPGEHPPPAGVEARRLRVYVDVCLGNIDGLLAQAFRVTRSITPAPRWRAMVADFYRRHRCQSPYFRDLSKQFLDYLETERTAPDDPPFLRELCHFEWVGRMLDRLDVTPPPAAAPPAVWLDSHFVPSPLARVLQYRFPVHTIGPASLPDAPPRTPTWLIVHRDPDDRVDVMTANAATARLVERLAAGDTLRDALAAVAAELGREARTMWDFGEAIARRLVARHILLPA